MKKIIFLVFYLTIYGTGFVVSAAGQPLPDGTGGGSHPPACITEARINMALNPVTVQLGQSSTLSWSVSLPNGCSTVKFLLNGEFVARSGSRMVTPPPSAYTLIISKTERGQYAERNQTAQLNVDYPATVIIDGSTPNPIGLLIDVLANSSNSAQVIELCTDLDLTGLSGLLIGDGRSLIASPACARGPRSFGPRIFVTDKRDTDKPLFVIRGDNVLFSGFRLQGPSSEIGRDDNNREYGIKIFPFDFPDPIHHIEISNMEIFNWSGAAIDVGDNAASAVRGRLFNTNVGAVHITNNFLHHNRHFSGYGYGVDVGGGAYALIDHNVFDENRHAIAGGSGNGKGDWSGYTARENLILPGGGLHCNWHLGVQFCSQTHQIDMHGDQNAWYSDDNWCCGTAGETIIIERNTILYIGGLVPNPNPIETLSWEDGLAIKIRGNPVDKAVVDGNVFRHQSVGDAIAQNGDLDGNITNPIDVRPNNVFGVDPTVELGTCDFFGDGKQDQFMTTGVTWWAKSPTTNQWRFLNAMPQRLPELQLRRIDPDAVCDVALAVEGQFPRKYVKSGMGPWIPVNPTEP